MKEDRWSCDAKKFLARAKLDGPRGESRGLCTLVCLSLFRQFDLLRFATAPVLRYIYNYETLGRFVTRGPST